MARRRNVGEMQAMQDKCCGFNTFGRHSFCTVLARSARLAQFPRVRQPMPETAPPQERIYFGEFELTVRTRELQKNGQRFDLQEQPFLVLTALLERPGELVTRDELIKRLWPGDTFVDFEHSLNK